MATAIEAVYRDMEYARSLIRLPNSDTQEESEESWTMVDGNEDEDEENISRRSMDIQFERHQPSLSGPALLHPSSALQ